jgi:tetratricopeptide (TPR) repeat protein
MKAFHLNLRAIFGLAVLAFGAHNAVANSDIDIVAAPKLRPAQAAIEAKEYGKAIGLLKEIARSEPKNADVQNLLGFSHRKLQKYDLALKYYQQALAIQPDHRGANEYLGELYLETGQLDKAEERLRVLDKACFWGCKEYDDLKADIESYKKKSNGPTPSR